VLLYQISELTGFHLVLVMMRSNILSILLFAITARGAVIEKRQSGLLGALGSMFAKGPQRVTEVKPQIRSDATRNIARWGPYELPGLKDTPMGNMTSHTRDGPGKRPGGAMDPNGFLVSNVVTGFCSNCTVLVGKVTITFEDGSEAGIDNGVYLHHVLFMDNLKTTQEFAPFCPGNLSTMDAKKEWHPVKSIFLSGGVEHFTVWYTTPNGKFESGYYVGAGKNPFMMTAEIVNYKPIPQKVYITVDYEYVRGKFGDDALSTLLTVTGCEGLDKGGVGYFDDKPQNSKTSQAFPVLTDGTIINARGHLHDGGKEISLLLNDKKVCTSKATYGGASTAMMATNDGKKWETISSMSACSDPIPVKRGDYLKMESVYDTAAHPLRESHGEKMEEMGIYTFSFVPKPKGRA